MIDSDLIVEVVSKCDGWTVRVWDDSSKERPLTGHWNFKYSFEECPNRSKAKLKALNEIMNGAPKDYV